MAANIITVCDALVTAIGTAWTTRVADNGTVARKYLAPVSVQELSSLTGRKVYVFPGPYSNSLENRAEDAWGYDVGIVVVERYTDAGEPLDAWMDARVLFVEEIVAAACDYPRSPLAIGSRKLRTEDITTTTYDIPLLNTSNLFWSELQVSLREIKAA